MDRAILTNLENKIKESVPTFEIKFKDESPFMKFLCKLMFFMNFNQFITTLGTKVYWPSRISYESNPAESFKILAHEFVHIIDYKQNKLFMLSYVFPQILAVFSLLSFLAFLNIWFLLCLGFLLFLAPIPSPGRKKIEIRGYGMSCRNEVWFNGKIDQNILESYVRNFTGPNYYYMWPFKEDVRNELIPYTQKFEPPFLAIDKNPAWSEVFSIVKNSGLMK